MQGCDKFILGVRKVACLLLVLYTIYSGTVATDRTRR